MRVMHVCEFDTDERHRLVSEGLRLLGHEVMPTHSVKPKRKGLALDQVKADLCLLHEWYQLHDIQDVRIPKAVWLLNPFDHNRRAWFEWMLARCVAAFAHDPVWVQKYPEVVLLSLSPGDASGACGELLGVVSERCRPKSRPAPTPQADEAQPGEEGEGD